MVFYTSFSIFLGGRGGGEWKHKWEKNILTVDILIEFEHLQGTTCNLQRIFELVFLL